MRKVIAIILVLCLTAGALPVLAEGAGHLGGDILKILEEKMRRDLSAQKEGQKEAQEETGTGEDQARVAVNLQAIKVMLDAEDLKFTYQEEQDSFLLRYTLNSDMSAAVVWLTAYDDGVWVRMDYEEEIPKDRWEQLMILCSLLNEDMRLGCFYVDRDNESLGYRFFLYTDVLPSTQQALKFALTLGVSMMTYRGNAVAAVLRGDMNAWDAFAAQK